MKKLIIILVGTPGSGKTWVANQLTDKFCVVAHDIYGMTSMRAYVHTISEFANRETRPVLCETPFSLTQIQHPLMALGFEVVPIFIIETPEVTRQRYEARENRPIPTGHLTRIRTYIQRAKDLNSPIGTAEEILKLLKEF